MKIDNLKVLFRNDGKIDGRCQFAKAVKEGLDGAEYFKEHPGAQVYDPLNQESINITKDMIIQHLYDKIDRNIMKEIAFVKDNNVIELEDISIQTEKSEKKLKIEFSQSFEVNNEDKIEDKIDFKELDKKFYKFSIDVAKIKKKTFDKDNKLNEGCDLYKYLIETLPLEIYEEHFSYEEEDFNEKIYKVICKSYNSTDDLLIKMELFIIIMSFSIKNNKLISDFENNGNNIKFVLNKLTRNDYYYYSQKTLNHILVNL